MRSHAVLALGVAILCCGATVAPKTPASQETAQFMRLRDTVPLERIRAMNGLSDQKDAGDEAALAVLGLALDDPDEEVRMSADWAVARFPDSREGMLDKVTARTAAPDTFVLGNAAAALGHLADISERAMPLLLRIASDTSAHVREGANAGLHAVRRVWPGQAAAMVDFFARCDSRVRFHAGEALVAAGVDAIPPLLALLENPDWNVRANAARTLGLIGESDGSVGPTLVARLADSDYRVRQYALQALGRLGTPLAHDAYIRGHGGEETHGPALTTLRLHGDAVKPDTSIVAVSAEYREWRPVLDHNRGDLRDVTIAGEWRVYLCDVETRQLRLLRRMAPPREMRADFSIQVRGWISDTLVVELYGHPAPQWESPPYATVTRVLALDLAGNARPLESRPKRVDYVKGYRDTPEGVRHFLRVHVQAESIGKFVDDGPEEPVFVVKDETGELLPATRR
jgi:hypothetical protein